MTEAQNTQPQAPLEPLPDLPSAGQMLKQARNDNGLTQQQVADKLHLKLSSINDIENDKVNESISMTFTKGYLKIYAKLVGLSDRRVLEAFERMHQQGEPNQPARMQSFSRRVAKQTTDKRLMFFTYIVAIVLAALVVLWWFQQDGPTPFSAGSTEEHSETARELPKEEQREQEQLEQLQPPIEIKPVEQSLNQPAERDLAQTQSSQTLANELEQVTDQLQQSHSLSDTEQFPESVVEATEEALPEDVFAQPAADGLASLIFEFDEDCWVNILDATGERIAYGVKKAGRVMPIEGVSPFEVTLGAPAGVSIKYNGEAVDLSSFPASRRAVFTLPMSQP